MFLLRHAENMSYHTIYFLRGKIFFYDSFSHYGFRNDFAREPLYSVEYSSKIIRKIFIFFKSSYCIE